MTKVNPPETCEIEIILRHLNLRSKYDNKTRATKKK